MIIALIILEIVIFILVAFNFKDRYFISINGSGEQELNYEEIYIKGEDRQKAKFCITRKKNQNKKTKWFLVEENGEKELEYDKPIILEDGLSFVLRRERSYFPYEARLCLLVECWILIIIMMVILATGNAESHINNSEDIDNNIVQHIEEDRTTVVEKDLGFDDDKEDSVEETNHDRRIKQATTVCVGDQFSVAIDENYGVVYSSKCEWVKQIADFSQKNTEINIVSITGKSEIIGLLDEYGNVYTIDDDDDETKKIDTSEWKDVIQIAAGNKFIAALFPDGHVEVKGRGKEGQNKTDWDGYITQIATGDRLTVGIDRDYNLHFAGSKDEYLKEQFEQNKEKWNNVKNILVAGADGENDRVCVIGIKDNGSVVWIGDPIETIEKMDELDNIKLLGISSDHLFAITNNDKVITMGDFGSLKDKYYPDKILDDERFEASKVIVIATNKHETLVVLDGGVNLYAGNDHEGQDQSIENWNVVKYIY